MWRPVLEALHELLRLLLVDARGRTQPCDEEKRQAHGRKCKSPKSGALCIARQLGQERQRLKWGDGVRVERRQTVDQRVRRVREETKLILTRIGFRGAVPSFAFRQLLAFEELQHRPRTLQHRRWQSRQATDLDAIRTISPARL